MDDLGVPHGLDLGPISCRLPAKVKPQFWPSRPESVRVPWWPQSGLLPPKCQPTWKGDRPSHLPRGKPQCGIYTHTHIYICMYLLRMGSRPHHHVTTHKMYSISHSSGSTCTLRPSTTGSRLPAAPTIENAEAMCRWSRHLHSNHQHTGNNREIPIHNLCFTCLYI